MEPQTANAYDSMLYHGTALSQTHPDRLATHARLMGLEPPPVEQCRVLELGCGNGTNLLPMAFGLPEGAFVGVDLAARPIALARETARAARISNIDFHQLDIMDLPADWGAFDYIIAYGLYSWVPEPVRDRLLEICRTHLAPNGVAFISYNVYPGWHRFQASREMMLFHVRPFDDPQKKARQGRALLHFLLDAQPDAPDTPSPYRTQLQENIKHLSRLPDWLLRHDLLSEINTPCYFHEFADHAGRHGLQFLSEAEFSVMHARDFPPNVTTMLNQFSTLVLREQYLDFLRGRSFRQSLLCHQDAAPGQALAPEQVRAFYAAAPYRETARDGKGGAVSKKGAASFTGARGRKLETSHPFTTEVCRHLGAGWPRYIRFDELLETARSRSGSEAPEEADARLLAKMLYDFYADDLLELHSFCPRLANEVRARPVASPLARVQLRTSPIVSGLLHNTVQLSEVEQRLLPLLDGKRGHRELLAALTGERKRAGARKPPRGVQAEAEATNRDALARILAGLMEHGLLIA